MDVADFNSELDVVHKTCEKQNALIEQYEQKT